jgi:sulfate adenylyltransferase
MVKVAACSTLASVAAVFLGSSSTAFAFVVPGGRVVAAPSTKVVAASTSSVSPMSMATAVEPATGSAQQQVPHGGKLVDLMLKTEAEKEKAMKACTSELTLSPRQLCDVELITNGGLSPLDGFMNEEDYNSVVANHRLTNGLLFGLPIVFDTDSEELGPGAHILLKQEGTGLPVATFEVTSKWAPDKALECLKCYGTSQLEHPGTLMVATQRGKYYLGGKLVGLNRPVREFDCASPAEVRDTLPEGKDVVAFQCRNPIHRAHYELFTRALDAENVAKDGVVLVHPTCGPTQADDIPGNVRYLTYVRLAQEVNNPRIRWAYLPYSMHMAGPREVSQFS